MLAGDRRRGGGLGHQAHVSFGTSRSGVFRRSNSEIPNKSRACERSQTPGFRHVQIRMRVGAKTGEVAMKKLVSSKHLESVSDLTLTAPIKQGFIDAFEAVTY